MEERVWAGVDVGKGFHWVRVVDDSGTELLSRRVENELEADLTALIEEVLSLAGGAVWAVDQPGGGAALFLLALLWERGREVFYVPGLSVDRARDGYRGESKTDRKDARVIARVPGPGCVQTSGGSSPAMTPSPGCSSCSPAGATSSPTGRGPSRGSGRRCYPSSRPWSGR